MPTIEISDELHEILLALAQQSGKPSVPAFIETLPEVRDGLRRSRERKFLETIRAIERENRHLGDLTEKFLLAVHLIYKFDPVAFEKLEGVTRPEGRAVFVSCRKDRIENTSISARPLPLAGTGFFVNTQGGVQDHERLIELLCKEMGVPPSIPASLTRSVLRAEYGYR